MDDWKGIRLIPLGENEPLRSGDRVLIRFKWLIDGTWLRAYQWNVIENKLEGRSDWRVISYRNEGDFLDAEIEVLSAPPPTAMDPGSGITQASLVIAIAITAASIAAIFGFVYLMKHDQYRLIMAGKMVPPVSSVAEVSQGLHVLAYVAGGVVALLILKTVLRR
jgi:hypothetical protein